MSETNASVAANGRDNSHADATRGGSSDGSSSAANNARRRRYCGIFDCIAIGREHDESVTEADKASERRRIVKNVFLISVAFLFNFNAFQGLSRLQSSLNRQEGMGVITSSVIYATLMLSCMFLPKLIINWIGHKWTITISFSGYILYMAANGYAVWGTLTTASVLVGLCAAPLWTAQCSYFTIIGQHYARLNNEREEEAVSRFFGIFFMFFQACKYMSKPVSTCRCDGSMFLPRNCQLHRRMLLSLTARSSGADLSITLWGPILSIPFLVPSPHVGPPQANFRGGPDPHGICAYAQVL
jgi:hypothetical protein